MTSPISINKGFSEKVNTAPVSRIGQRFYVPTKNALAVASPTTLGVDPLRQQLPENEELPIHPLYGFLYVADKEEGLVIIGDPNLKSESPGVGTLLDGNPANNFLKRALAFNPDGALTGARRVIIAGTYAYILTDKALVVVDLYNPLAPRVTATVGAPALNGPRGIAVQFRYAFVVDREGLKVLDVSDLSHRSLSPMHSSPLKMPATFTLRAPTPMFLRASKDSRSLTSKSPMPRSSINFSPQRATSMTSTT